MRENRKERQASPAQVKQPQLKIFGSARHKRTKLYDSMTQNRQIIIEMESRIEVTRGYRQKWGVAI